MKAAFSLHPVNAMGCLKALAQELRAQHPGAVASVPEGLEQMFSATRRGVQGSLACSLSNTNIIESPNSVVRRIKGFAQLQALIRALRPQQEQRLAA
jgi:hypothetical protein